MTTNVFKNNNKEEGLERKENNSLIEKPLVASPAERGRAAECKALAGSTQRYLSRNTDR